MMKINDVSKLTGLTVRALHYYDSIGLLKPSKKESTGYRYYTDNDVLMLQQIMFFKELDFSLDEIKVIISNPDFDIKEALYKQREILDEKRKRLDGLVLLIDSIMKGKNKMSFEQFNNSKVENLKKRYAEEVKKKWGNTNAYKEYEAKQKNINNEQKLLEEKGSLIIKEFSNIRNEKPNSEKAKKLVEKWQKYITENFYTCTIEILKGLAEMYITDERFTEYIDKNGEGTAKFMHDAICEYCK